jgi:lipopolysaccharide/colanic/teichoic acid biosynthesis glycosyltransferase
MEKNEGMVNSLTQLPDPSVEPSSALDKAKPAYLRVEELSNHIARSRIPRWKRALDLTLVLLASPIWVPVSIVLAVLIKIVSPGPALFRQERVGHMGARFRCLKLRTMKVNADPTVHRQHLHDLMASDKPMLKLDCAGDARLIPGGLWLRTLGLDELPQLFNVLRGEMSLVGPRPSTVYEFAAFKPCHRQRCATPPGLTGLWQVSGKNRTSFQKMMELDLQYTERKSLLLDIKILVMTFPAILLQCRDSWVRKRTSRSEAREPSSLSSRGEARPMLRTDLGQCS